MSDFQTSANQRIAEVLICGFLFSIVYIIWSRMSIHNKKNPCVESSSSLIKPEHVEKIDVTTGYTKKVFITTKNVNGDFLFVENSAGEPDDYKYNVPDDYRLVPCKINIRFIYKVACTEENTVLMSSDGFFTIPYALSEIVRLENIDGVGIDISASLNHYIAWTKNGIYVWGNNKYRVMDFLYNDEKQPPDLESYGPDDIVHIDNFINENGKDFKIPQKMERYSSKDVVCIACTFTRTIICTRESIYIYNKKTQETETNPFKENLQAAFYINEHMESETKIYIVSGRVLYKHDKTKTFESLDRILKISHIKSVSYNISQCLINCYEGIVLITASSVDVKCDVNCLDYISNRKLMMDYLYIASYGSCMIIRDMFYEQHSKEYRISYWYMTHDILHSYYTFPKNCEPSLMGRGSNFKYLKDQRLRILLIARYDCNTFFFKDYLPLDMFKVILREADVI